MDARSEGFEMATRTVTFLPRRGGGAAGRRLLLLLAASWNGIFSTKVEPLPSLLEKDTLPPMRRAISCVITSPSLCASPRPASKREHI